MAAQAHRHERARASREEHARVHDALIALCFERGFGKVTVEGLCRRADVDRTFFDDAYADLDDCFCQTLEAQRDDFFAYLDCAVAAIDSVRWVDRVRAVAYGLFHYLGADRARTHFLTTELNAGPERARRIWTETIARPLFDLIDEGRREPGAPSLLTRATAEQIGGGIFSQIYAALGGGQSSLPGPEIVPKLMYSVVLPYLGPEAAAEELTIPPPVSVATERARLREALLELCFERDFAQVSVEDLCRRAGVERAAFERLFTDLEDCFLHFYEPEMQSFRRRMASAQEGHSTWRGRLRATAYELFAFLVEDERRANFVLVESRAAGERSQLIFAKGIEPLFDLLDEGRTESGAPASLTRATAEQIGGGIFNAIYAATAQREPLRVELVPQMMYTAVLPYLGKEAATEELTIPPPRCLPD